MMMSLNFTKGNKTGNDIETNNQPTKKKIKSKQRKPISQKYMCQVKFLRGYTCSFKG